MTDLISRADAIDAVRKVVIDNDVVDALKALPSAVATTVGDYPNDVISRNALMEYCSNQKSKSVDNNDIARFPSAEADCSKCKHKDKDWDSEECDSCCGNNNHYESAEAAPKIDHDRDWIIGCLEHDGFIHTHRFDKANQIIHDALSAEQGWIPCSERLPKAEDMYQPPEQRYLCQLEAHGERKFCVLSRLKGAVSPFWDWYGIAVYDSEVTAWMPLPTPYKGGDDE
jgi:hypothetical protein